MPDIKCYIYNIMNRSLNSVDEKDIVWISGIQ